MSAEAIRLLQDADEAFRGSGGLSSEGMQRRLDQASNALYLAMKELGIRPRPYR